MFRSLFDRKPKTQVPEVLDLTIGRNFTLDPIEVKLLSTDALFVAPDAGLTIVAQGICDLGEQSYLHRFYPDDDRYLLQIQGGDGKDDPRIDEVVLWYFHDVQYLSRDTEWSKAKRDVRQSQYELPTESGSVRFDRAWFDHSDAEEDPMTYWEDVRETRDADAPTRIFQTAMLFGRSLQDGTDEMLLVNLEEPENGDRALSCLIGRALPQTALLT